MTAIANLRLDEARPEDRVHLLVWETPNNGQLQDLAFRHNAERVDYRRHLLQRHPPNQRFLVLHHHLERELAALKTLCQQVSKPIILLEGFDCFITYLLSRPNSPITPLWTNLDQTRKLESRLWILLPPALVPPAWDDHRQRRVTTH